MTERFNTHRRWFETTETQEFNLCEKKTATPQLPNQVLQNGTGTQIKILLNSKLTRPYLGLTLYTIGS